MLFVDVVVFVSRIHVRVKYSRPIIAFLLLLFTFVKPYGVAREYTPEADNSKKNYSAGRARVVNLGDKSYSRNIMCRNQWHFRSNLQTSSSVWLFKEYDSVLADLNISVFTTLCCNVVAI